MTREVISDTIRQGVAYKWRFEIVYRTPYGKAVTEEGIIRDVFRRNGEEFLILESGLPILTSAVIHILRMEG